MNSKVRLNVIHVTSIVFVVLLVGSCSDSDSDDSSRCQLEPEAGPCNAAILKYYYDKEEQKCKEFIWGGCNGIVPFDTLEECIECE